SGIVPRDKDYEGQSEAQHQKPEKFAAHDASFQTASRGLAAFSSRLSRRFGSRLMIFVRSALENRDQPAISSTVRPQPRHSPDLGSRVQILTQGVSIVVGRIG